jgi:type IV secretory pathway component VirB8
MLSDDTKNFTTEAIKEDFLEFFWEQERSFTKDKKKKRKDTRERLKIQSQRQETKTGDSVKFMSQELFSNKKRILLGGS